MPTIGDLTGREDRKAFCKDGEKFLFTFQQGYDGNTLKDMTVKGIVFTESADVTGKIEVGKKYGVYIYEYGVPLSGTDQGNIWNPSGGAPGVTDGTDPNTAANLAIRRDGDVKAYETAAI